MADHSPESLDTSGLRTERLESWKEIAAHLNRHVTTVRRWEKLERLPVHRHMHGKLGSVYAYPAEIDRWWRTRLDLQAHGIELAEGRGAAPAARPGSKQTFRLKAAVLATWRRWSWGGAIALCSIVAMVSIVVFNRSVAHKSGIQAPPDQRTSTTVADRTTPAAHQEYLVGRYYLWRDNEEHLRRAIAHFERATAIDAEFAPAYASLAHAWWKLGLWTRRLKATEPPARAAVQRALQLDGSLADAYAVQSDLERLFGGNLVRAESLVQRALALNPNHVDAHYTYGLLLMTLGRFGEAISHMQAAEQLDPLAPAIQSDFGRALYRAGRYDAAIQRLNRALELEPAMDWLVQPRLAAVYEQTGQYELALEILRRVGSREDVQLQIVRILAHLGNHREARRLLAETLANSRQSPPNAVAAAYAALGDRDRAFALLLAELDRGDPGPNFVAVDPPLASLRSDPRWERLLQRIGERQGLTAKSSVLGPPLLPFGEK